MSDNRRAAYNIGRALQRLRKDNGWTLSTVSAKTGVAISTLSKIENNQSSPNYDVLIRLAEGLGVDFVELVKGGEFLHLRTRVQNDYAQRRHHSLRLAAR